MSGVWIFGYGSLVDPSSFGATLGRALRPGVDFFEAELAGFGRRWNYGVMHTAATGPGPDGADLEYTIVALGIVGAPEHQDIDIERRTCRGLGRANDPGVGPIVRIGNHKQRCSFGCHVAHSMKPSR